MAKSKPGKGQSKIVLEMISQHGQGNPVHGGKLARVAGLSGQGVRAIVNEARCSGTPIASSVEGYWMATSEAGLQSTLQDLQGRVNQMMRAINGLRKAFDGRIDSEPSEQIDFDALLRSI